MKKNPLVLDIYNYQKTGSISVDMCVACIQHERRFNRPIKAIVLSSAYYSIFKKWVCENYDEETAEAEFAIDDVTIRREIIYTGKSLIVEYFKAAEMAQVLDKFANVEDVKLNLN